MTSLHMHTAPDCIYFMYADPGYNVLLYGNYNTKIPCHVSFI